MSETATSNPPDWAPWRSLLQWQPFKIDALGLVTLLGAEEVNAAVGRLVRSSLFEYFPLLGAFVISGNSFRNKEAGFNLYNLTQGIHTTDISAWLSRWMKSQDFEVNRSLVRWTVEPRIVPVWETTLGLALPFVCSGMLVAMTILSYDWYGFANAIAMITSIAIRSYLVSSIRQSIDERVTDAYDKFAPHQHRTSAMAIAEWEADRKKAAAARGGGSEAEAKLSPRPHYLESGIGWNGSEPAKFLVIMNDAKAVTMIIPRDLLAPPSVFIANLEPRNRALYGVARWLGWLAFAVQVITIGMADLATQIVTVTLLVIPTVLFVARLGCDDSKWWRNTANFVRKRLPASIGARASHTHDYGSVWPELKSVSWIGSMLKAEVYEWPRSHEFVLKKDGFVDGDKQFPHDADRPISKRQFLYAWLQLSTEEKISMDKWDLFPHKRNNNTHWVKVFDDMTARTIRLEGRGNWGINSLHGTSVRKPSQTAPPVDQTQPPPAPKVPAIDTKVPKHHHHGTKSSHKSSNQEEETKHTADTAQDGTMLDQDSPAIHDSPTELTSPRAAHRTSIAVTSSRDDERDGIRPVRRTRTEPVAARGSRHSISAPQQEDSAFWVTSSLMQQERRDDQATSESDDTISANIQSSGNHNGSFGDMH